MRIHTLLIILVLIGPAIAGETDIWEAALKGDQARIEALLKQGVDINSKNRYQATALLYACEKKHWDLARYLLEQGADPNVEDNFYHMSALQQAWLGGNLDLGILMLQKGYRDVYFAMEVALRSENAAVLEAVVQRFEIPEKLHKLALAMTADVEASSALLKKARVKPDPPPLKLDEADLKTFAGTYRIPGTRRDLVLKEKEGGLTANIEGQTYTLHAFKPRQFWTSGDELAIVDIQGRAKSVEFILFIKDGETLRFTPVGSSFDNSEYGKSESMPVESMAYKNWPGFRGEKAYGVNDNQNLPLEWDVEAGTHIRWKTEIPGLGHASPVIWEDLVFIATAISGEGNRYLGTGVTGSFEMVEDYSEHEWKLMALDSKTGKLVWEKSQGVAKPLAGRHFKSTHANSTPVTDGKRLVTVYPTAGMFCYNLQGDLLWKVDLGGLDTGWFYDTSYQWGFASSPILYKNTVILQVDIQRTPYIAAWDLDTGKQLWKTPRDEIPTWSTPNVYDLGKDDELVVNGTTIRGYNPTSGEELWKLGPNAEVIIAAPLVTRDLIYVTAGYPPARPIYAIRPGQRGDISLPVGDSSSKAIAWSHDKGGAYMPTPLLYRGNFYIGHHDGRLAAYNAKTGKGVFRARLGRGAFTGSPVASDGRMFFPNEDGSVYVVEAGSKYKQLAVNDMKEVLMATPAIANQTLYIRTRTHLFAIGAP